MKWTFFIILALLFFACDNKVEINTCDNKDCKSLGDKFCDGNNLYVCLIKDGCLEKQQIKRCENGCNQGEKKCNLECTENSCSGNGEQADGFDENGCKVENEEIVCNCDEGYKGKNCELKNCEHSDFNTCKDNKKCDENGDEANATCSCTEGYKGTNCEFKSCEHSDFNTCKEHGTCSTIENEEKNDTCAKSIPCSTEGIPTNSSISNNNVKVTWNIEENEWNETPQCAYECQNGYFKFETEENVECKKRISCKISPAEVNNDSDNNFDGRIYLTLEGKDLNDGDLTSYSNNIKLVIKKINGTQKTYTDNTQIEDSTKFYFDLDPTKFPFEAIGEYNYYIELSAGENDIIKCDTDGSDNDESNDKDSDSTKSFTDEKRGKIKVKCENDFLGDRNTCPEDKPLCIYGKCEKKAASTEDCNVTNFRGHEYKFCGYGYDSYGYSNTKTWEAAKTDCGTNSHLVKIENAVENEWIKKNIGSNQFWIGLHRNNNNSPWRWDGESEDANLNNNNDGFSDWSDNNEILSDENCSFMQKSKNGSWYSALLAYHLYICESESSN